MEIEQCSGTTTIVVQTEGSVSLIANSSVLNEVLNSMLTLILILKFLHFTNFQLDFYKRFPYLHSLHIISF